MPTLGATIPRNNEVREGTSSSPLPMVSLIRARAVVFERVFAVLGRNYGAAPDSFVRQVASGTCAAFHIPLATRRTKDSLIGGTISPN